MFKPNGAQDVITYFVLRDSTTHAPRTDIVVTDLDLYYVAEQSPISDKVDATALAFASSAHSDNAAYNVGQGIYRVDWPDEAFDGGVGKKVTLIVVCSGVDNAYLEVELSPGVDVKSVAGTSQTAGDLAALITTIDGVADGIETHVDQIDSRVLGTLVAGNHNPQSGDAFARLGEPAGASISADILDLHSDVGTLDGVADSIKADTGEILIDTGTTLDGKIDAIGDVVDDLHNTDIPDLHTHLETIAGYLDTEITAILDDTNELQADLTDGGRLDLLIDAIKTKTDALPASPAASGDIPSADAIADQVWNEAAADHDAVGSFGEKLNDAGGASDPWNTPLPGGYGPGTAGQIVGDNLNAPVGTVDTVVDTMKGVLDDLHDTDLPAVKTDTGNILTAVSDLKGTGFAKDTDSLVNLSHRAGAKGTDEIHDDLIIVGGMADAIKTKTDSLAFTGGNVHAHVKAQDDIDFGATQKASVTAAVPNTADIADKFLGRAINGGGDGGRIVKDALKILRNRRYVAAGVLTVCEADDETPAWTADVTTAAGNPVSGVDPA